jgi:hypothetical protein
MVVKQMDRGAQVLRSTNLCYPTEACSGSVSRISLSIHLLIAGLEINDSIFVGEDTNKELKVVL